jgi:hypothetical protein
LAELRLTYKDEDGEEYTIKAEEDNWIAKTLGKASQALGQTLTTKLVSNGTLSGDYIEGKSIEEVNN